MFYSGLFVKKDDEIDGEELIHKIEELLKLGTKVKVSTDVEISAVRENVVVERPQQQTTAFLPIRSGDGGTKGNDQALPSLDFLQTLPPGDIQTQPNKKMVINGPFNERSSSRRMKIINASGRRIAWQITQVNTKLLSFDRSSGVLDAKEAVTVMLHCAAFIYGMENTSDDSIRIEWTNCPEGASKFFKREWFEKDGMVRWKVIVIEYNP